MVKPDVPEDTTVDYSLEFVWKSTSFDRMNTSLKLFKDYSASISGYLFHVLLGHEVRGWHPQLGHQGRCWCGAGAGAGVCHTQHPSRFNCV